LPRKKQAKKKTSEERRSSRTKTSDVWLDFIAKKETSKKKTSKERRSSRTKTSDDQSEITSSHSKVVIQPSSQILGIARGLFPL
jgi:hypothetical protein